MPAIRHFNTFKMYMFHHNKEEGRYGLYKNAACKSLGIRQDYSWSHWLFLFLLSAVVLALS